MADIYNTEDLIIEPEVEDILGEPNPVPVQTDVTTNVLNAGPLPVEPTPFTIEQYFGTLQNAVLNVWKLHLATKRHFEHVELERTYHILLSITDRLIEMYMGCVGNTLDPNTFFNTLPYEPDTLTYLNSLTLFVRAGRNELFDPKNHSEIYSILDELLTELDQVSYKIKTFKEEPIQTYEEFSYSYEKSLNEGCDCDYEGCDCDYEGSDEEEEE